MKNRTRIALLLSLLMLSLLLAACGGEEPVATATPTKTPTPLATDTPVPTDTPAPPTDTPVPTDTPEPTATPTPEGTPTPTPNRRPLSPSPNPSQDDVNTRKGSRHKLWQGRPSKLRQTSSASTARARTAVGTRSAASTARKHGSPRTSLNSAATSPRFPLSKRPRSTQRRRRTSQQHRPVQDV